MTKRGPRGAVLDYRKHIDACVVPCPMSGCWLWLRGISSTTGYGAMQYHGRVTTAHRAAYEEFVGPIPAGMLVMHRCDNRLCVNPAHLEVGTDKTNAEDKVRKGRQSRAMAKLTKEAVLEIREQYAKGAQQAWLAKQYGIAQTTVSGIVNRRRWQAV
jgi:hypothetical protein